MHKRETDYLIWYFLLITRKKQVIKSHRNEKDKQRKSYTKRDGNLRNSWGVQQVYWLHGVLTFNRKKQIYFNLIFYKIPKKKVK